MRWKIAGLEGYCQSATFSLRFPAAADSFQPVTASNSTHTDISPWNIQLIGPPSSSWTNEYTSQQNARVIPGTRFQGDSSIQQRLKRREHGVSNLYDLNQLNRLGCPGIFYDQAQICGYRRTEWIVAERLVLDLNLWV